MNKSAVLALDIGGTNIRIALVSEEGIIIDRFQSPCLISEGRNAFLTAIGATLDEIMLSARMSALCIVAVGAGVRLDAVAVQRVVER